MEIANMIVHGLRSFALVWIGLAVSPLAIGQDTTSGNGTPNQLELAANGQENQALSPITAPPEFANLTAEHLAYIEKLLEVWEQSSSQVKLCECEFQRWDYDASVVAKRDPNDNRLIAHRIVRGTIRFSSPDKAHYETTDMWSYQKPEAENPYVQLAGDNDHEKWICDGDSIYEFDFINRILYETKIPPELRGSGLVESPLPFLFGAKKQQILDRYWLRVATPAGIEDEYWLVAVPKRTEDAQTYSKVEIILAREDYLPKSLHVYSANFDPTTSAVSHHIEFTKRKINGQLAMIKDFLGVFVRPGTPINWRRVEGVNEAGIPASTDQPQLNNRVNSAQSPSTNNNK